MSKIIETIDSMISNHSRISDIRVVAPKYFFIYDSRVAFCVTFNDVTNTYTLTLYPDPTSDYNLIAADWQHYNIPSVTYKSADFNTIEAVASFRSLYNLINGKVFNIDSILDSIIRS